MSSRFQSIHWPWISSSKNWEVWLILVRPSYGKRYFSYRNSDLRYLSRIGFFHDHPFPCTWCIHPSRLKWFSYFYIFHKSISWSIVSNISPTFVICDLIISELNNFDSTFQLILIPKKIEQLKFQKMKIMSTS